MKWRGGWDIVWLDHQGIPVRPELTETNPRDRGLSVTDLRSLITAQADAIRDMRDEFTGEMREYAMTGYSHTPTETMDGKIS